MPAHYVAVSSLDYSPHHAAPPWLQLEAAQVSNAEADHAASHLGKAVGLAMLLRGTAHLAQR